MDPSKLHFPTGESKNFDPRKQQIGPESYPGIRVVFGGLVSLLWFSQFYPIRMASALVPCIGPQFMGSMWGTRPPLGFFPAQGRPTSWPVVFHYRSPGQQGLLGDVIVRLWLGFCVSMSMCALI